MSKGYEGHQHYPARNSSLAAAPVAVMTATIPAQAVSPGVTPELANMIEKWKIVHAEYLRLVEIDNAATALHHRTAPEIPERIIASPNK